MIAVAIVCAAVMSQAAQMTWSTWGWTGDSNPDLGDWITGGQAYLVMVTDAGSFSVADNLSITGGSIVDSKSIEEGMVYGTWQDTGDLVGGQTYQFAMILTTDGASIDVPTTGKYTLDNNDGALYDVTWNAATGGDITPTHEGVFMNTAVGGTPGPTPTPTPVPEPTSGLLMVLGVAGLALRRRRG